MFLDAPVEELFRRCQEERRSNVHCGAIRSNFAACMKRAAAHYLSGLLRIETGGKDMDTVAAEVAASRVRVQGIRSSEESSGMLK